MSIIIQSKNVLKLILMKTTINIWIMLFFAFAIQATVLAILFFLKRKGDRIANSIFGVFLLLFSYNQIFNCAYWSNYQGSFVEHLSFTNFIPWVSYGPLLYVYIKRVLKQSPFTWTDLRHSIPIVWIFSVFGRFYFLPYDLKLKIAAENTYENYVNWWPIPREYMVYTVTLLMFLYVFKIYSLYKKEKVNVTEPQRLWIKSLWFCFAGYAFIFFIYFLLIYFDWMTISNDYLIGYGITFFVGIVTYFSFMQPSNSLANEMKNRLVSLMESDKLFLDNSLTLDVLSEELNLSRHHTSQLINEHFQVNFFEFVNNYRINEAIMLLQDQENRLNINQIIYAIGFNNRTSFYNAFKKKTGISPKSYRKKHKKTS